MVEVKNFHFLKRPFLAPSRSPRSHNVRSFIRPVLVCLKLSIFVFLSQISLRSVSGQSQVSLRSVPGQSLVSLRSLLSLYELTLSVKTEPKILRLVYQKRQMVFRHT